MYLGMLNIAESFLLCTGAGTDVTLLFIVHRVEGDAIALRKA